MLIAYGLVITAVGMDLKSMRISNRLILTGLVVALVRRVFCEGISGFFTGIVLIFLPVILLYLLFLAGALGAGDIKLFSLVGGFIQMKELIVCIIVSFLFAAIVSLVKMLYLGTFFSSMKRAVQYFYSVLQGNIESYQPESKKDGCIHFSVAILVGLIFTDIYLIS